MAEHEKGTQRPDLRKEPNRRADRNPDYAGPERRIADRRKSPRT